VERRSDFSNFGSLKCACGLRTWVRSSSIRRFQQFRLVEVRLWRRTHSRTCCRESFSNFGSLKCACGGIRDILANYCRNFSNFGSLKCACGLDQTQPAERRNNFSNFGSLKCACGSFPSFASGDASDFSNFGSLKCACGFKYRCRWSSAAPFQQFRLVEVRLWACAPPDRRRVGLVSAISAR